MSDSKILKYDTGVNREIQSFEVQDLRNPGPLVYQTPTLRASPAAQGQKERRFQYDPLLKDVLSTDEETEKLIESRVEERLTALREEALDTARDEGHREGFEKGEGEAKTRFEGEAKIILTQLETLLNSVENQKADLYAAQGRYLQELTFRIAEVILQREIAQDKEHLRRLITDIVERVGAREMVKVIVHPSQLEHLAGLAPELEKKFHSLRSVSFETSEQLEPTDCVVETDFNRIDATLRTQLDSLHEMLGAKP